MMAVMDEMDASRGAFGQVSELDWREQGRVPRELQFPGADAPTRLSDALPQDLRDEIAEWKYVVPLDAGILYEHLPAGAAQYILTSSINDAIGLMEHVDRLDGRSAAHAARVLFEHLVNLWDVLSGSSEVSDRYLDHRHVTAGQVADRRWYFGLLDKQAAKRERNRLDGLAARTKRPLADAIEKYGKGFRLSWSVKSLKARADLHGLSDGYDGYRILSSAIHGSSGAMAGVVKPIRGQSVHRIGGDLDLAATAYAEGLQSFYRIADRLRVAVQGPEVDEILGRTEGLLLRLQTIRETLHRLDKRIWPSVVGPPTVTVAGIWPSGKIRWYIHDLRDNSMVLADLIDLEPDLTDLKQRAAEYEPEAFGGRPVSVAGFDIRATPRPNSPRVPASSILVPPSHPAQRRRA